MVCLGVSPDLGSEAEVPTQNQTSTLGDPLRSSSDPCNIAEVAVMSYSEVCWVVTQAEVSSLQARGMHNNSMMAASSSILDMVCPPYWRIVLLPFRHLGKRV